MQAFMQYEHEQTGVVARWHGGEYVELGYIDVTGEFIAGDVINVWDYAKGEPRIPRTLAAFEAKVDERMADLAECES